MKLSSKLIAIGILPILVTVSVYQTSFFFIIEEQLTESSVAEVTSIITLASTQSANYVYFLDIDSLNELVDNLEENPSISSVLFMHDDGRVITDGTNANTQFDKIPHHSDIQFSINSNDISYNIEGRILHSTAPIIIDKKIGILHFDYSLEHIDEIFQNTLMILIGISLVVSGVSIAIIFFISRTISKPIEKLQSATFGISDGNFHTDIEKSGPDEIKDLIVNVQSMAEKLEHSKEELLKKERLSSIGELSARLSHDLRNPLSVLKNAISILEIDEDKRSKNLEKYLPILKDEIERMSHQINEVLEFVKTRPLNLTKNNSTDIIQSSLRSLKIPQNIRIIISPNDFELFCDRYQLESVFTNIIINAIQAIGERDGKIRIDFGEDSKHYLFIIEDDGPGIPKHLLDRIFEPLYTTKQTGTGLGLVSCKTIIEQHGGTISATNSDTTGAIFTIILPKQF